MLQAGKGTGQEILRREVLNNLVRSIQECSGLWHSITAVYIIVPAANILSGSNRLHHWICTLQHCIIQ